MKYILTEILLTLIRVLPFPSKTGIIRMGNPGRNSPVILTCNFRLTVERVKRVLKGLDVYLLVSNSRGVNVWCAATGGLLTNHDVISTIKTSGIEKLVDHRNIILPQLAATGVEGPVIAKKTGWKVIWGPVYAASIPAFIKSKLEKTPPMRNVSFPWRQRLEMAISWAFPISLLALPVAFLSLRLSGYLVAIVWSASLIVFLSFPLYEEYLNTKSVNPGFIFFDFRRGGLLLILWAIFMIALIWHALLSENPSWQDFLTLSVSSLILLMLVGIDLMGSTPTYKSSLHEDRNLTIAIDSSRCKGVATCFDVCPKDVFRIDYQKKLAVIARMEQCVKCGACIVQCPCDALFFGDRDGGRVGPEVIRRFKLNLLGSRKTKSQSFECHFG